MARETGESGIKSGPTNQAVRSYELSYELDFMHPDRKFIWKMLFQEAEDVWVESLDDVHSGLDYNIQNATAAHYEDIAIRRILKQHDLVFAGQKIVRIRTNSESSIGRILSTVHIRFLYPEYIEPSSDKSMPWWDRHKGSLECFWHSNKILQIKDSIIDSVITL